MVLAQTVAVSFAMNLFFLAILLTPVSQSLHTSEQSSTGFVFTRPVVGKIRSHFASFSPPYQPPSTVYIVILLTCYIGVLILPFSTSTRSFMPVLLVPHAVLFLPVYLDRIAPKILSSTPGRNSPRPVYQFMAYSSMALFVKQAIMVLVDTEPGAHTHKHSTVLEFQRWHNAGYHNPLDRSTTAPGRVLKSLGDHPAAASVGWDVILCGFSLIVWASIRRLEITKITGNAGLNRIPDFDEVHDNGSKMDDSNQSRLKAATMFDADHGGQDSLSESTRRRRVVSKSADEDIPMSPVKADNGEEEMPEKPESAAASCALFVLGGLGAIASGVLGAESERS